MVNVRRHGRICMYGGGFCWFAITIDSAVLQLGMSRRMSRRGLVRHRRCRRGIAIICIIRNDVAAPTWNVMGTTLPILSGWATLAKPFQQRGRIQLLVPVLLLLHGIFLIFSAIVSRWLLRRQPRKFRPPVRFAIRASGRSNVALGGALGRK